MNRKFTKLKSLVFNKFVWLFEHRAKLKEEGLDNFYKEFIKELLVEKISLSLRGVESSLLSEDIYRELSGRSNNFVKDQDRHKMNVFYNSHILSK